VLRYPVVVLLGAGKGCGLRFASDDILVNLSVVVVGQVGPGSPRSRRNWGAFGLPGGPSRRALLACWLAPGTKRIKRSDWPTLSVWGPAASSTNLRLERA